MALNNPPYEAPYAVLFTDPETGEALYWQIWDGGGYRRANGLDLAGIRKIKGNNDRGYEDA